MPRYDFRCPKCGNQFEVSRRFNDADLPALCPVDGVESERVYTMPMTFFKGNAVETPMDTVRESQMAQHGHSHGPGSDHAH